MGFKCGIVGLPNVGKSTLFNALTEANIQAANYPFCTIDPNLGVVPVPDLRLAQLAKIVQPKQIVPTTMEFVDIAGLVAGAANGEGLGNQFLAHIRETDAIAHVVRCFDDNDVIHVAGRVAPVDDAEIINTELALADLETCERHLGRAEKAIKGGDLEAKARSALLLKVVRHLNVGEPIRTMVLSTEERALLRTVHLLTSKPMMYIANIAEGGWQDNPHLQQLQELAHREGAQVIPVCAAVEAEIAQLSSDERPSFLADLGIEEAGLQRVLTVGYGLLGLLTFFTAGPKEVRAWTVVAGATAPQAAGRIHGDFERGFIRAEIIAYDDYLKWGGEQGARDAGKLRVEGRNYRIKEGDVVHFRFNV